MPEHADTIDLGRLSLAPGEGRRLQDLEVPLGELELGGQVYGVPSGATSALLDVSRMAGAGWSLRLRFTAPLAGPCMRCLNEAADAVSVDAREVHDPGAEDAELRSPYVRDDVLDLASWARDALALALPARILCRADCRGLCPECGADLNAHPDHAHEREPDPRWAALRELKLD